MSTEIVHPAITKLVALLARQTDMLGIKVSRAAGEAHAALDAGDYAEASLRAQSAAANAAAYDENERIIEQVKSGASPAEILAGMARVAAEGIAASHTGTPNSHARHWLINYEMAALHDTIATYIVAMVEATNSTPAA